MEAHVRPRVQRRLRRLRQRVRTAPRAETDNNNNSLRNQATTRDSGETALLSVQRRAMLQSFRTSIVMSQWALFSSEQQFIHDTLRSPNIPLETKLSTVILRMQAIQKDIYLNSIHILHVWSRLNYGPNPKGGPGWCYGLSLSSGAWVMLCWYDHPCSDLGVNALSAYPGQVFVDDGPSLLAQDQQQDSYESDLPRSMLPSKQQLTDLRRRLSGLKAQLEKLPR